MMQKFLENLDQELAENRNKRELRDKGKRQTTIKTIMGGCLVKAWRETIYAVKGLNIPSNRTDVITDYTVDKYLKYIFNLQLQGKKLPTFT